MGRPQIVGISGQNASITGNLRGSVRNAALITVAKNLADAVAGSGVTINTVNPGTVVNRDPERDIPPARGGESTPDDTANLIAYLVSPLGGAISGESIAVGHRVRGVT